MRVIAHRGASRARRENTLPAFELAHLQGADGVELDVRRTADRRLRVLHDPAPSGGRPLVERLDADVERWIPSLDDALAACRGIVNVEIKDLPGEPGFDDERTTARLVARALAGRPDPPVVSSFDPGALRTVAEVAPDLPLALLSITGTGPAMIPIAVDLGARAVHPADADVDAEYVRAAHGQGLEVNVWTVDDPDRIRQLARWGVDGVITNDPAQARSALVG